MPKEWQLRTSNTPARTCTLTHNYAITQGGDQRDFDEVPKSVLVIAKEPGVAQSSQSNRDDVAVELVTRWVLRADQSVEVYSGVFLNQFHDGRQALGEGPMVLLQPGESWAGPITADDGDGESVIVNVTFAN